MFETLRERLDALLGATAGPDRRAGAEALAEAAVEARAAVMALREARDRTSAALEAERRHLEDAERRGRLAADIPDPETVRVARGFAERHRGRADLLARKLAVQEEEVALAEREAAELADMLRQARGPAAASAASLDAARRELDALDPARAASRADAALAAELDRQRRAQAVEAQLDALKQRMRRGPGTS